MRSKGWTPYVRHKRTELVPLQSAVSRGVEEFQQLCCTLLSGIQTDTLHCLRERRTIEASVTTNVIVLEYFMHLILCRVCFCLVRDGDVLVKQRWMTKGEHAEARLATAVAGGQVGSERKDRGTRADG